MAVPPPARHKFSHYKFELKFTKRFKLAVLICSIHLKQKGRFDSVVASLAAESCFNKNNKQLNDHGAGDQSLKRIQVITQIGTGKFSDLFQKETVMTVSKKTFLCFIAEIDCKLNTCSFVTLSTLNAFKKVHFNMQMSFKKSG